MFLKPGPEFSRKIKSSVYGGAPATAIFAAISTKAEFLSFFSIAPLIGKRCENALIEAIKMARAAAAAAATFVDREERGEEPIIKIFV